MDILWAPWRMEYVTAANTEGTECIFCPMVSPGDDRERLVLVRGLRCFIVLNRYPYNPGHLMIVPQQHSSAMTALSAETWGEMLAFAGRSVDIVHTVMQATGANCGLNIGRVAGAGITDHLHLHVVPRWPGDTNFLPVLGATKSMPEYLVATYDRLQPHFATLGRG